VKQGRFSEEKIVGIWREAEKGEKPVADLCREYGGLDTSDVQRLKELTSENARLKQLLRGR
jgi:putative transposase